MTENVFLFPKMLQQLIHPALPVLCKRRNKIQTDKAKTNGHVHTKQPYGEFC